MEYALMGLLLIFSRMWNALLNFEVTEGVYIGGVLISLIILKVILNQFRMESDSGSGGADFRNGKFSGSGKGDKSS